MISKIYLLGLMSIPFDNLFFAPSAGWATISPILFFIYNIFNLRKTLIIMTKKEYKLVILIYILFMYSFILYILNGIRVSNLFGGLQTIALGFSFYIALINRYVINKNNFDNDMNILIKSYMISFMYGLIKYISLAINLNILIQLFELLEKRSYSRLAFSFTEPSFIAMHLFGIILPIYFITKSIKLKRKIKIVGFAFLVLTLISKSTTRFILDTVVISIICIIYYLFSKKIKIKTKIIYIYALVLVSFFVIPITFINLNENKTDSRISKIISEGIYADASLASRYFRINASVHGYKNMPLKLIFGAGIGNSYVFFDSGYDNAFNEYKNPYVLEILNLKNKYVDQLYSMPIRLISEFGLLVTFLICILIIRMIYVYKGNILIFMIISYLYIQFDSYAFYSIWIYIFYIKYKNDIYQIKNYLNVT